MAKPNNAAFVRIKCTGQRPHEGKTFKRTVIAAAQKALMALSFISRNHNNPVVNEKCFDMIGVLYEEFIMGRN